MSTVAVALTQGHEALIDAADLPLVSAYSWHYDHGYARTNARQDDGSKRTLYLHRLLVAPPSGFEVDHINRNALDNRRSNLRLATSSQQKANTKLRRDNSTGYRGVYWVKSRRNWVAQIRAEGRRRTLGYFHSAALAARRYDEAAREVFGDFASLNFPDDGGMA